MDRSSSQVPRSAILQLLQARLCGGAPVSFFFDQPHEAIELQELLEMTVVSLIIHIAKWSDSGCVSLQEGDSVFTWRYALVEQVCAVEVARPIAVREGILRVLVDWIKSSDREKIRDSSRGFGSSVLNHYHRQVHGRLDSFADGK
jgi:hypothetical protein